MKDEGTETAFRLDQCKHFRKSKHLLKSEVNRCDQSSIALHLRCDSFQLFILQVQLHLSIVSCNRLAAQVIPSLCIL